MKNPKNKIKKNKKKKSLFNPSKRHNPEHFFNRELSWLEFNSRVLNEADDPATPLLEKLRFLSIYSNNLDEFIMKRVGGLKGQLESEYSYVSIDGQTPKVQLDKIREHVLRDNEKQHIIYNKVLGELRDNGVQLLKWSDLTEQEKSFTKEYFMRNIFPILTPLSVDPGKPFPFISSLSTSFGLFLENPIVGGKIFSRVKIPDQMDYWLELDSSTLEEKRLVSALDIIENNLGRLYPGMKILETMPFRVTRNADLDHDDEDTEDLLELIEESINNRRLLEPIRIECLEDHSQEMLKYLMDEMDLGADDLYLYANTFDFSALNSVADLDIPNLKYSSWRPQTFPWFSHTNIFDMIREKDRLVHHPYENFQTSVERMIVEASQDPSVLSIKMTLYRTGDNSQFIKSLIEAAENGIQVVCLIELKARFDEKRNIHWARKMEDAGVHVVYGIVGLKTHTKIAMVVRREHDGELLRYAHIATGNYNAKTARIYTDLGLFTINNDLTSEINEVFNYLTGSSLKVDYNHLLVAPVNAKSTFLAKIAKQTQLATEGKKVKIIAKMNSFEDTVLAEALYEASSAGVEIILIVRGFCVLKPGVPGLSENIKVISVIGRFLEHSRIFYFSDGENEWSGEYYIGSADWMHRNMHARVEVITPIVEKNIKKQLKGFLDVMINDQRSAWDLLGDGSYVQRTGEEKTRTHTKMMKNTLNDLKKLELNLE